MGEYSINFYKDKSIILMEIKDIIKRVSSKSDTFDLKKNGKLKEF